MNNHHSMVFMDHIRRHTSRYFPGFRSDQACVKLYNKEERPSATLYQFQVSERSQIRSVIVKVPLRNLQTKQHHASDYEKPQLFQKSESEDLHRLQYTALAAIHQYFGNQENKDLGAIRVLDYLPEYHAIFTEALNDPKLQQLFLRESRLNSPLSFDRLTDVFRNVGTWLKMYHAMPKDEDVQTRHQHREDYIDSITKLSDYLSKTWGEELFFKRTASVLIQRSRKILPELLPVGLGHGDFAMRNILIGPHARVTVLDTVARWRTPIYEDIGYFLNGLKMSYPQVISQGLLFRSSQLRTYEQTFLKGYFASMSIPYTAIRLYEMLALLDKWSSVVMHYHRRSVKLKSFGRVKVMLASLYLKRSVISLLEQIDGVESDTKSTALERSC